MFITGVGCGVLLLIFSPSKRIPVKVRFKIQRIRLGIRMLTRKPFYGIAGLVSFINYPGRFCIR